MATYNNHWPGCLAADGGTCTCDALEAEQIARATRPTPAELIREAKAKGLISNAYNYEGQAPRS